MVENNESFRGYVCPLSLELQDRAEKELNERPQWRDRDVEALRQMVLEAADLRSPTDYAFLLCFLRAKKFDYDRAFACLRRYYDVRRKYPEVFGNFVPSSVKRVLDSGIVTVLPVPDRQGRRVIWLRLGLWDPEMCPLTDVLKAMLLSLEWVVRDENIQVNGIVLMNDYSGVSWKQFRHMTRERVRMITLIIQEAFPIRLKAIHMMNTPSFMHYLLSLFRLFLKEKLRNRIHVHNSRLSALFSDIGEVAIPVQYGGQLEVEHHRWRNELLSPHVEAYFAGRVGEGFVDAPIHINKGNHRLHTASTCPGNLPLLGPVTDQSPCGAVNSSEVYDDRLVFSSLSVCQASTDSD